MGIKNMVKEFVSSVIRGCAAADTGAQYLMRQVRKSMTDFDRICDRLVIVVQ